MTDSLDTLDAERLDPADAVVRHPSGWWKTRDGRWISPRDEAASAR